MFLFSIITKLNLESEQVSFLIFNLELFKEKYFSSNILSPEHISLSDCLHFIRYWAICVLQLFVKQIMTS